ncbi:MAG: helix-turn-helix domain-containing protein [Spirochaetaceae bacterium]|nr:helix-turn-helix domain-containing protein [Spirochaetaceae bacterium]
MYTYRMTEKQIEEGFPFFFDWNLISSGGFHEHTHDFRELVIIAGGTGLHSAGGDTYPVIAGDIFVLNAGQRHGFIDCHDLEIYSLGFENSILRPLDTGDLPALKALLVTEPTLRAGSEIAARLHLPPGRITVLRDMLEKIGEEWSGKSPGYVEVVRNHFENLMIQLARYYDSESHPSGHSLTRLTMCMNILETDLAEKLDLKGIAEENGFRYAAFREEVKRIYGITPLQFLIHQRITRAADLLRETDERISQIGYDCGFEDSNYFSRMFRKETGLSPRDYRRANATGGRGPVPPKSPDMGF